MRLGGLTALALLPVWTSAASGDFQLNTHTASTQRLPALCAGANGTVPVVWASDLQDGSGGGVFGRILLRDGSFASHEFQVNAHTIGHQSYPAIACEADGEFIVVWTSNPGPRVGSGHIFSRRFAASGVPLATEFQISQSTYFDDRDPAVAMAGSGEFVVSWTDGFDYVVRAQAFAADTTPVSEQFVVGGNGSCIGQDSRVAWAGGPDPVFAWRLTECDEGVFAGRFSHTGERLNNRTVVQRTRYGAMGGVCAAPEGGFTVAWSSHNSTEYTEYEYATHISARRFDGAGMPQGPELVVRDLGHFPPRPSALSCDEDGGFIVVWNTDGDVLARAYDPQGKSHGEFVVNDDNRGEGLDPAVVSFGGGEFLVVWSSISEDGDGAGIFGRSFASAVPTFTPPPTPTPTSSRGGGCVLSGQSNEGIGPMLSWVIIAALRASRSVRQRLQTV